MAIPDVWVDSYDALSNGVQIGAGAIGEVNSVRQTVQREVAPLYAALMRLQNADQTEIDAAILNAQHALYPLRQQLNELRATLGEMDVALNLQIVPLLDNLLAGYVPPQSEPES